MLSVVDFVAVDGKRRRAASEKPRSFEELDLETAFFQRDCSRKSGEPTADDCYTGWSHDPTITSSFSEGESDVLPRSGKSGSRSIFSKMRS